MDRLHLFIFLFTYFISLCLLIEGSSFSTTFLSYASLGLLTCRYEECCDKPWINLDITDLREELKHNFYGQHLAESVILGSLSGFLKNDNPQKALAMSFNGITGSGKSFVSKMIAKHLYKQGMQSNYVHLYIANKDFPHAEQVSQYQDRLREEIPRFTKECSRSLFIFEEVEKMPSGTIDILKPFLDYHNFVDGIDYRKNIFIFLSNSGSQGIVNKALDFWANGKDREDITIKDIEPLISKGAFNEKGGFQHSELLSSSLIDVFAPFLPMEVKHVRNCIEVELKKLGIEKSPNFVKKIAESLQYFPEETELFSVSGCKRIESKVNLFMEN